MKYIASFLIIALTALAQEAPRTVGAIRYYLGSPTILSIPYQTRIVQQKGEVILRPLTRDEFFYHLSVLTNSLDSGSIEGVQKSAATLWLPSLMPDSQEFITVETDAVPGLGVQWRNLKNVIRVAHSRACVDSGEFWQNYRLRETGRGKLPRARELWYIHKSVHSNAFFFELMEEGSPFPKSSAGYLNVLLDHSIVEGATNQIPRRILYAVSRLSLCLDGIAPTLLTVDSVAKEQNYSIQFIKSDGTALELSAKVGEAILESYRGAENAQAFQQIGKSKLLDQIVLKIYTHLKP